MGVEYRSFLLPRDRSWSVTPERVAALVERLRKERWVLTPAHPAFAQAWASPPGPADRHATGGWAEPYLARAASPKLRFERARQAPIPVDAAWVASLRDPASADPQADEAALVFHVGASDEGFDELGLLYPFAYGEDEPGYHDILVLASRDYVRVPSCAAEVSCACGEDLAYDVPPGTIAPIELEGRIRATCPTCLRAFDPSSMGGDDDAFRFAVVVDCGKGWPVRRRVGEAPGIVTALEHAGYHVENPPPARPRDAADTPGAPEFEAHVARSPYGDPAPPVSRAFRSLVEETVGVPIDSIDDFY